MRLHLLHFSTIIFVAMDCVAASVFHSKGRAPAITDMTSLYIVSPKKGRRRKDRAISKYAESIDISLLSKNRKLYRFKYSHQAASQESEQLREQPWRSISLISIKTSSLPLTYLPTSVSSL